MAYDEPQKKRYKQSIIAEHIYSKEFQEVFFKHWHNCTAVKTENMEIIAEPFRICKISDFIKDEELMEEVRNELLDVKSRRNSIDLYQFEQTNDLANVDTKYLKLLFETFQTDIVSWMESNMKIELNKKISISSSCYTDTDFLLCHDDNLEDRRIAFVLYLSKNWEAADGGALDLFSTDEYGLPKEVVRSIVPEYNSLVFFEVTENSFHQVAEIVSPDKCRWSINGWFHGPLIEKCQPPRPNLDTTALEPEDTTFNLEQWISKLYLKPETIRDIKVNMEYESWALLTDFLLADVYDILSEEVANKDIRWKTVGPADERKYEVADEETLPEKLKEFCKLFKSKVMFDMMKKYTELDLVSEKEGMNPRMRMELQRWTASCYTLISDNQVQDYTSSSSDKKSASDPDTVDEDEAADGAKAEVLRPIPFSGDGTGDNCLGEAINTPPSSDDEVNAEILKKVLNGKSPKSRKKDYTKLYESRNEMRNGSGSEEADVEENGDDEIRMRILKRKATKTRSLYQATSSNIKISPSQFEMNHGTDSEESDIEDYLSDPHEHDEEEGQSLASVIPGSLDVIFQFHTENVPANTTIDYVCPREDRPLIHVPAKDNYLCLAFKTKDTCRVHNYVNHYCKGYYYNLLCTYYE